MLGKVVSSLSDELSQVEWGLFKLDDLFEKISTQSLGYKAADLPSSPQGDFILPALSAGIQNQGLNNYVPRNRATILRGVISISANGANTGATFYQNNDFTILQDAYAIKWKKTNNFLTDNQYLFLTGSISKKIYGNYEWTNKAGWARVRLEIIPLPTENGEIDFDFMESFIAALEAERIAQLEAYLVATGLKNYELTAAEKQALQDYQDCEFASFKLIDIFNVKNTDNILSRDIVEDSGVFPYLCASAENNSVSSYISYDSKFLDKGNCIFIGGKTFVVSYQENDFYSNDSHNLALYLKQSNYADKLTQFYLATCVKTSIGHQYSWGDSISNKKIQKDQILLPTKNQKPDYDQMAVLISAVQKLIIKDVVCYVDKKTATGAVLLLNSQKA